MSRRKEQESILSSRVHAPNPIGPDYCQLPESLLTLLPQSSLRKEQFYTMLRVACQSNIASIAIPTRKAEIRMNVKQSPPSGSQQHSPETQTFWSGDGIEAEPHQSFPHSRHGPRVLFAIL